MADELIPEDEYAERLRAARADGRIWPDGPTEAEVAERAPALVVPPVRVVTRTGGVHAFTDDELMRIEIDMPGGGTLWLERDSGGAWHRGEVLRVIGMGRGGKLAVLPEISNVVALRFVPIGRDFEEVPRG